MSRWTRPPGVGDNEGLRRSSQPVPPTRENQVVLSLIFLRKVAAFDELGDDEAETIVRATHVIDRHDMGMVQAGKDAGFVQVSLDILGMGDSFRAWDFDRDGAVEIVIEGKIDPSEPALPKTSEDRVTPDLRGMEKREGFLRILTGGGNSSVEDRFSDSSIALASATIGLRLRRRPHSLIPTLDGKGRNAIPRSVGPSRRDRRPKPWCRRECGGEARSPSSAAGPAWSPRPTRGPRARASRSPAVSGSGDLHAKLGVAHDHAGEHHAGRIVPRLRRAVEPAPHHLLQGRDRRRQRSAVAAASEPARRRADCGRPSAPRRGGAVHILEARVEGVVRVVVLVALHAPVSHVEHPMIRLPLPRRPRLVVTAPRARPGPRTPPGRWDGSSGRSTRGRTADQEGLVVDAEVSPQGRIRSTAARHHSECGGRRGPGVELVEAPPVLQDAEVVDPDRERLRVEQARRSWAMARGRRQRWPTPAAGRRARPRGPRPGSPAGPGRARRPTRASGR